MLGAKRTTYSSRDGAQEGVSQQHENGKHPAMAHLQQLLHLVCWEVHMMGPATPQCVIIKRV